MKIALFTNTYYPHVGGVAKSVKTLEDACRQHGHQVRVVAPENDAAEHSPNVLRVPAIQNFNGSDFAVRLPFPNAITDFIEDFEPDLIHSHHPFLLGDAALRKAWRMQIPIVFTHHTLYERYTHYVPLDSPALKRVAIQLAIEYCNLCDLIIAPSESIKKLLIERRVTTPIESIPTGIDLSFFASGDGAGFREKENIPLDAKVIGHVGRLAKEKNLLFLAEAVANCLKVDPKAIFLVVGDGDARKEMETILRGKADEHQIHMVGKKTGQDLADAYAAMDWFVFASQSETQGMVLAEAMAGGKPVVALDGPGVREIVINEGNGLLLNNKVSTEDFSKAIIRIMDDTELTRLCAEKAKETAEEYGADHCYEKVFHCYERLIAQHDHSAEPDPTPWDRLLNGVEIEWDLLAAKMSAAAASMIENRATEADLD